jgi:hypothetical protein
VAGYREYVMNPSFYKMLIIPGTLNKYQLLVEAPWIDCKCDSSVFIIKKKYT